ncbi:aminotransferase class I/II-fold pyridoxal phosphate-dependent enzyme [Actinoplanes sp. CA-030573]|uniref:aminotransferase class I/II-fold pyridoxal phosphate-dependent enzyme n=1 Tax=Actinoplanes sp. CA-030573 TaxID=3239898 RepID=UPI003D90B9F1
MDNEAERRYAEFTGARNAIFTSGGAGVALHGALVALLEPGRKVLSDRHVHRDVVASMITAGAEPVWLPSCWDDERQIPCPAPVREIESALDRDPQIRAVLVVTPTEHGICADLERLAAACHRRDVPLLVDEERGGHFAFHPGLPTAAIEAGADIVVHHPLANGETRPSVVLSGGGLVDADLLRVSLDAHTGAEWPALDAYRETMSRHGCRLLDAALDRAERIRERLAGVSGLTLLDQSIIKCDGVAEWDPLTLTIDVSDLGITGWQARDCLRDDAWRADGRRVVRSLAGADDAVETRVVDGLRSLAAAPPRPDRTAVAPPPGPQRMMSPRAAYLADSEPVADPAGRISADAFGPVIMPGECFSAEVVRYLRAASPVPSFRVVRA